MELIERLEKAIKRDCLEFNIEADPTGKFYIQITNGLYMNYGEDGDYTSGDYYDKMEEGLIVELDRYERAKREGIIRKIK